MSFLYNMNWRYAAKEFDTNKPVSKKDLDKILESIRMAPTSYGLQALHIYVVENLETRKKIKEHSFGQAQIDTSSHVLVFCTRTDSNERVDQMIDLMSANDEKVKEKLKGMEDMMKGSMANKSEEEIICWSARQAYIALGFAMAACTELKVDSCPMEGFVNEEIDKILKLPPHIKSIAFLAIGHRLEDPKREKFRFPNDDLFTHL
jgi:nitroreductase / dihydropteridine reductase